MSFEEAYIKLKDFLNKETKRHYAGEEIDGDLLDAIDIVLDAAEKQISKKPIIKEEAYRYCLSCKGDEDSIMYDNMINSRYDYCKDCGQKLDWSDFE